MSELDFFNYLQRVEPVPTTKSEPEPTEEIETTGAEEHGSAPVPARPESPVTSMNLFQHPGTHPLILDLILLKRFGAEWMEWEPETVWMRVKSDFRTQAPSEANFAKLQACKTMHMVDTPWEQFHIFTWCVLSLNGVLPDFDLMQVPTLAQCLVGMDIANRIREDVSWSDEIKGFVGAVYQHDGIFLPIAPADFSFHDMDLDPPLDAKELQSRWSALRGSGKGAPTGQSVMEEQLRRLALVQQYLDDSRAALKQQFHLVGSFHA